MGKAPTQKKVWILWRYENVNGVRTKVPYQANNKKASTTDPSTWSTFTEVEKHRANFDGIGFCFDGSTLGIDLDHIFEHPMTLEVQKLLDEANTYIEVSPSGNGVHIIFNLTEPFEPEANKHNNPDGTSFECYSKGRYFTFTQNQHEKSKPIRSIDAEEANRILSLIGYPWKKTPEKPAHTPVKGNIVDDMELVAKMFSAGNGKYIKALWDGDISKYNDDQSSADMAMCMHLAFWTGNDFERIERLWMMSPLGQREKTQERADYRRITIENAIAHTSEVYEPAGIMRGSIKSPLQPDDPEFLPMKLMTNKSGTPHNNLMNAVIALEGHPRYSKTIRYNSFQNKIEIDGREITDNDYAVVQAFLQGEVGLTNISFDNVKRAVGMHSFKNKYDEALDWLKSLTWDGVPRLEHWLVHSCGVEPTLYHRAIGAQWMLGMVGRLVNAGMVFDHVLTMYGAQGIGKTSFFRAIGGKWYKSHTESVDGKDFYMKLQGACLIDLDEGATMFKSDSIKLKSIITETCDEFRAPWGTVTQKFPRRFVFSMSTNDPEPLKDQTGNRRYWILRVENKINLQWVEENRDQLFAEAYHAVVNKVEYPAVPMDVAAEIQEQSTEKDEWIGNIHSWLVHTFPAYKKAMPEFSVSISEVYEGALKGEDISKLDRRTQMRIGNILTNELHLARERRTIDGTRQYRYTFTKQGLKERAEEYEKTKDDIIDQPEM